MLVWTQESFIILPKGMRTEARWFICLPFIKRLAIPEDRVLKTSWSLRHGRGSSGSCVGPSLGCPGQRTGQAVTAGSPGGTLEWHLLGQETGGPGTHFPTMMYRHLYLMNTPNRLWPCIIAQRGQNKDWGDEQNRSVLWNPRILTAASLGESRNQCQCEHKIHSIIIPHPQYHFLLSHINTGTYVTF